MSPSLFFFFADSIRVPEKAEQVVRGERRLLVSQQAGSIGGRLPANRLKICKKILLIKALKIVMQCLSRFSPLRTLISSLPVLVLLGRQAGFSVGHIPSGLKSCFSREKRRALRFSTWSVRTFLLIKR